MAKRFIDVYKALKLLKDRAEAESYLGLSNNLTEFAIAFIERQPEADAVEVVRCKDCDVPHNRWFGCPNLNGLIPPPDFYCAKGERRKTNEGIY